MYLITKSITTKSLANVLDEYLQLLKKSNNCKINGHSCILTILMFLTKQQKTTIFLYNTINTTSVVKICSNGGKLINSRICINVTT